MKIYMLIIINLFIMVTIATLINKAVMKDIVYTSKINNVNYFEHNLWLLKSTFDWNVYKISLDLWK